MTYSPRFYDSIRAGSRASAGVVVPLIMQSFQPATVIDVGCGEGCWGAAFAEHGCDVLGIDGVYVEKPAISFEAHDLAKPLPPVGHFDLAVCLEVAEHLPPARAESFVADLCQLAPTVLFSAAVPGQGGTDHLNEQWAEYWAAFFREQGYDGSGALRWDIWGEPDVKWWYRQNLLVFGDLRGLAADGCPSVLHPDMWRHHKDGR